MSRFKKSREYLSTYFSIRPFEQYGLLIALFLVIIFVVARFFIRQHHVDLSEDILAFQEAIAINDSTSQVSLQMQDNVGMALASFDPNEISTQELLEMGIPPSAAKSIVNFRKSGFQYRTPNDLLKCYGVDQDLLDEIGPFVIIQSSGSRQITHKPKPIELEIVPFPFNPNTVTIAELESMNLPDRFIQGFVNFRNSGAKFYSVQDVEKIYSLTPKLKEALIPYLQFSGKPAYKGSKFAVRSTPEPQARIRFRFDPNTITKDSLILLGIRPRTANTWVNYRNGGKVFYESNDLKSLYGLDSLLLLDLTGWMIFPIKKPFLPIPKKVYVQPSLQIEPNGATSEEFQAISGVGTYYANAIVWYRDDLGGFVSIDQIGESKNLPDSVFQKIKYHFITPSADLIQKINVNETTTSQFVSHPYMGIDNVKRIISRRDVFGDIPDFDFLVRLGLLSKDEAAKMGPYLRFD